MINDTLQLNGAKSAWGNEIRTYDDGFGPLWIMRGSLGVLGIVRAQTWEDAYSICEDEFFPEADETIEEIVKEYGFKREHVKVVRDENGERDEKGSDYSKVGLRPGISFVRWDVRETLDPEAWPENELFQEAFGFRPNGPNVRDKHKHGIYAKDLNGESLDRLTLELLEQLDLTLDIGEPEETACAATGVNGIHSEAYYDDGICLWCGKSRI